MKYKLYSKELNDLRYNIGLKNVVLRNRGIIYPDEYSQLNSTFLHTNISKNNIKARHSYWLLDGIEDAKNKLNYHMQKNSKIGIICDSDVDGNCSASILYMWLCENYKKKNIEYYIHSSKQHGISKDIKISEDINLLFVPDAGTNDVDKCKELSEKGVDIIILDHHESEKENPYAIIVNPQLCNYPNKYLSGCGVVKKFLECVEDGEWLCTSDKYDDLVALSIISDSMSLREYENRYLVTKGLNSIHNKLFKAIIEKQSYSMNNVVNVNTVAFYVTPLINAIVRMGSLEDKEMMFKAFCEQDQYYPYKKRGETEETQEDIYTRTARIATNLKAKQGREVDKLLESTKQKISKYEWDKNKILFANADDIDYNYTGLVCIKLANEYNRPCILIREGKDELFSGSARNYGNSILDLKDYIIKTGLFEMAQGHSSAFGISIKKGNIQTAIDTINQDLKDIDMYMIYMIDFEIEDEELTIEFIKEMNELYEFYGNGIDESYVLVKNVRVNTSDIKIMGENKDTISFTNANDCSIIKFKVKPDDDILKIIDDDWGGKNIVLNIIGKVMISNFKQILTPQLVVSDYEIVT